MCILLYSTLAILDTEALKVFLTFAIHIILDMARSGQVSFQTRILKYIIALLESRIECLISPTNEIVLCKPGEQVSFEKTTNFASDVHQTVCYQNDTIRRRRDESDHIFGIQTTIIDLVLLRVAIFDHDIGVILTVTVLRSPRETSEGFQNLERY